MPAIKKDNTPFRGIIVSGRTKGEARDKFLSVATGENAQFLTSESGELIVATHGEAELVFNPENGSETLVHAEVQGDFQSNSSDALENISVSYHVCDACDTHIMAENPGLASFCCDCGSPLESQSGDEEDDCCGDAIVAVGDTAEEAVDNFRALASGAVAATRFASGDSEFYSNSAEFNPFSGDAVDSQEEDAQEFSTLSADSEVDAHLFVCSSSDCGAHVVSTDDSVIFCPSCSAVVADPQVSTSSDDGDDEDAGASFDVVDDDLGDEALEDAADDDDDDDDEEDLDSESSDDDDLDIDDDELASLSEDEELEDLEDDTADDEDDDDEDSDDDLEDEEGLDDELEAEMASLSAELESMSSCDDDDDDGDDDDEDLDDDDLDDLGDDDEELDSESSDQIEINLLQMVADNHEELDADQVQLVNAGAIAGEDSWIAFYGRTPVAMASLSSVAQGAREIFNTPKFAKAVMASLASSGVVEGLAEAGFKPIVPEGDLQVTVEQALLDKAAQVAQEEHASFQAHASEYQQRLASAVSVAVMGMGKGFFPNLRNPLRDALISTMSAAGIANPAELVDNVVANHFGQMMSIAFNKANEIISYEPSVQEQLAAAVDGTAFVSNSRNQSGPDLMLGTPVSDTKPAILQSQSGNSDDDFRSRARSLLKGL